MQGSEERMGTQRCTKVAPRCVSTLAVVVGKRHSWDEAMLISEKIKLAALAILKLCLSESISK